MQNHAFTMFTPEPPADYDHNSSDSCYCIPLLLAKCPCRALPPLLPMPSISLFRFMECDKIKKKQTARNK